MEADKHVFIIGCKGIPASYGGFETFVDKLTSLNNDPSVKFHVACIARGRKKEFEYNSAHCFGIKVPDIGAAKAVLYDLKALKFCCRYLKRHRISNADVYILTCRVGPFLGFFKRRLKKRGARLLINPDGHEWKRSKWNRLIKRYWKLSERLTLKKADLVICDSMEIRKYILEEYRKYRPNVKYIAYGADLYPSTCPDAVIERWNKEHGVTGSDFYLIVARLVPENNFRTIVEEFMRSDTSKKLILIADKNNKFYNRLQDHTGFERDPRIQFAGTVYDRELLKRIREEAFCYIHGHEVGGTNPSLLEALASTRLNLIYDVEFNREVAGNAAFYFTKEQGNLTAQMKRLESLPDAVISKFSDAAKDRITKHYDWEKIYRSYLEIIRGDSELSYEPNAAVHYAEP